MMLNEVYFRFSELLVPSFILFHFHYDISFLLVDENLVYYCEYCDGDVVVHDHFLLPIKAYIKIIFMLGRLCVMSDCERLV